MLSDFWILPLLGSVRGSPESAAGAEDDEGVAEDVIEAEGLDDVTGAEDEETTKVDEDEATAVEETLDDEEDTNAELEEAPDEEG